MKRHSLSRRTVLSSAVGGVLGVTDMSNVHRLNSTETGELISVVTHGGIEGNYTLGDRNRTEGWLDWAKSTLVGKNVIDLLPTVVGTSGMKASGGFDATPSTR